MCASVSFCTPPSARCSSSEPASPASLQLAQVVHHVAADVADRDAALLDDVRATLTSSRRRSSVNSGMSRRIRRAVVGRVQAQVGLIDRLLDRLDRGAVERLDRQQPRLGRGDRRELAAAASGRRSSRRGCGRAAPGWRGRCGPCASSLTVASTDLCIRSRASSSSSSIIGVAGKSRHRGEDNASAHAAPRSWRGRRDERADLLAGEDPRDVARGRPC